MQILHLSTKLLCEILKTNDSISFFTKSGVTLYFGLSKRNSSQPLQFLSMRWRMPLVTGKIRPTWISSNKSNRPVLSTNLQYTNVSLFKIGIQGEIKNSNIAVFPVISLTYWGTGETRGVSRGVFGGVTSLSTQAVGKIWLLSANWRERELIRKRGKEE